MTPQQLVFEINKAVDILDKLEDQLDKLDHRSEVCELSSAITILSNAADKEFKERENPPILQDREWLDCIDINLSELYTRAPHSNQSVTRQVIVEIQSLIRMLKGKADD